MTLLLKQCWDKLLFDCSSKTYHSFYNTKPIIEYFSSDYLIWTQTTTIIETFENDKPRIDTLIDETLRVPNGNFIAREILDTRSERQKLYYDHTKQFTITLDSSEGVITRMYKWEGQEKIYDRQFSGNNYSYLVSYDANWAATSIGLYKNIGREKTRHIAELSNVKDIGSHPIFYYREQKTTSLFGLRYKVEHYVGLSDGGKQKQESITIRLFNRVRYYEIHRDKRVLSDKYIYKGGRLIKTKKYSYYRSYVGKTIYKYDAQNNLTEVLEYDRYRLISKRNYFRKIKTGVKAIEHKKDFFPINVEINGSNAYR